MHAHGVHVLDGTHDDHVVAAVAHQLELVFLPAEDGLLDEDVRRWRGRQPAARDPGQVLVVVGQSRTETAHGERRPDHDREAELGDGLADLVHRVADGRLRGLATDLGDDVLELLPILAALDGVEVGTDQLDAVLGENSLIVQCDSGIERRLSTEGGEHGLDGMTLLGFAGEDLLDEFRRDRLDVGGVGELGVGHDRRGVGVDEADTQSFLAQHSAGLGAGVVELTGLTDDDRAGSDDQDVVQVCAAWHYFFS